MRFPKYLADVTVSVAWRSLRIVLLMAVVFTMSVLMRSVFGDEPRPQALHDIVIRLMGQTPETVNVELLPVLACATL